MRSRGYIGASESSFFLVVHALPHGRFPFFLHSYPFTVHACRGLVAPATNPPLCRAGQFEIRRRWWPRQRHGKGPSPESLCEDRSTPFPAQFTSFHAHILTSRPPLAVFPIARRRMGPSTISTRTSRCRSTAQSGVQVVRLCSHILRPKLFVLIAVYRIQGAPKTMATSKEGSGGSTT